MAILTGVVLCVLALSALVFKILMEARKTGAAYWFATMFTFSLILLILCAGHWIALLLSRL